MLRFTVSRTDRLAIHIAVVRMVIDMFPSQKKSPFPLWVAFFRNGFQLCSLGSVLPPSFLDPSKLAMEVLKRLANREAPRPGQEWPFSVEVAPPTRMVVARVRAGSGPPFCHARSRRALCVGGLGRWIGGEWGFARAARLLFKLQSPFGLKWRGGGGKEDEGV